MASWGEQNLGRMNATIAMRKNTSDAALQSQKQLADILQYLNTLKAQKESQQSAQRHETGMENLLWGQGTEGENLYQTGTKGYDTSQPGFIEGLLKQIGIGKDENALYAEPAFTPPGVPSTVNLPPGGEPVPLGQQLPNLTQPKYGTRQQSTMTTETQKYGQDVNKEADQYQAYVEEETAHGRKPVGWMEWAKGYMPVGYGTGEYRTGKEDVGLSNWIKSQFATDPQFQSDYMTYNETTGAYDVDMNKTRSNPKDFLERSTKIIKEASTYDEKKIPWTTLEGQLKRWSTGEMVPAEAVPAIPISADYDKEREKVYQNISGKIAQFDTEIKKVPSEYMNTPTMQTTIDKKGLLEKVKSAMNNPARKSDKFDLWRIEALVNQILNKPMDEKELSALSKAAFKIDIFGEKSTKYEETLKLNRSKGMPY